MISFIIYYSSILQEKYLFQRKDRRISNADQSEVKKVFPKDLNFISQEKNKFISLSSGLTSIIFLDSFIYKASECCMNVND